MELEDLEKAATPAEMAVALEEHNDVLHVLQHSHAQEPSVREETYKGHRIKVVTTYEIAIDGQPVTGHLNIDNNGSVHYHAIPNQEFPSMIGMVKRIIDLSIDLGTIDSGGHDHGGHDHDHGEG
ncbi:MAG: hypothetical protein LC799_03435 [Actinobacteria bacterium]|nr:hypothetical protein [Actinomycetota bacterium]